MYTWRVAVQPYIKNDQIFTCPSNVNSFQEGGPPAGMPRADVPGNYTIAAWMFCSIQCDPARNQRVSGLIHGSYGGSGALWQNAAVRPDGPSNMILITESGGCGHVDFSGHFRCGGSNAWFANRPFAGHNKGANFGYADGHVKWKKWLTTMKPTFQYPGDCCDMNNYNAMFNLDPAVADQIG